MIQERAKLKHIGPMEMFEGQRKAEAEFADHDLKGALKRDKKRDSKKVVGAAERLLRKEENARLVKEENDAAARTCDQDFFVLFFLSRKWCVYVVSDLWGYTLTLFFASKRSRGTCADVEAEHEEENRARRQRCFDAPFHG